MVKIRTMVQTEPYLQWLVTNFSLMLETSASVQLNMLSTLPVAVDVLPAVRPDTVTLSSVRGLQTKKVTSTKGMVTIYGEMALGTY